MRYPSVAAQSGSKVVTANPLLAQAISAEYTRKQQREGKKSWERPSVLTLQSWMAELWQTRRYSGKDIPDLLSQRQELAIWERLFATELPDLFDPGAAARLAVEANRIAAEWHIPEDSDAWYEYADAAHFRRIAIRFRRECERRNSITYADLWNLLPRWIDARSEPILFAGFSAVSAGLRNVLAALGGRGKIVAQEIAQLKRLPKAYRFETPQGEFEAVARWARRIYETNPSASIGVLVPDLTSVRVELQHAFVEVFFPNPWGSAGLESGLVRLGASAELTGEPLVRCAYLLLRLAAERTLDISDASALLRSAFLPKARAEADMRALADVELRQWRDLSVNLRQIERSTQNCPVFQQVLRKLSRADAPLTTGPARWSDWIGSLLDDLDWPGEAEFTEREQRVLDCWNSALTELSTLQFVSQNWTWPDALAQLQAILRRTAAPEAGDEYSPIQILDADAAAGLQFDYAALTGFSEGAWPKTHRQQPFLPARLRRQAGIPGSTAESTREMREYSAALLLRSARSVLVTYSEEITPWFRPFVQFSTGKPGQWNGSTAAEACPPASLDALPDENGLALPLSESVAGGVGILKSQSACPFQAYGRYRLRASAPEDASFGMDARERGGTVHKALENIWRLLQTSERLASVGAAELETLIAQAVDDAVREQEHSPFQLTVSRTERIRLRAVLREWLQVEKERLHPFEIAALEEKREIVIGGLRLNVRIDRMDRLQNGSVILIDYKTGMPSVKQLLGDRPEEPQLLAYAAGLDEEVAGVYFAQVRERDMKGQGMASVPQFPQKPRKGDPDWATEQARSREVLAAIASEFVSGIASVTPQPKACSFCGLDSLCRIAASGEGSSEDADA